MKRCLPILLSLALYCLSFAQAPDTTIVIHGKGTRGPYALGFQNLVGGSITLSNNDVIIPPDSFRVEQADGLLYLSSPLAMSDSVEVSFQYLPIQIKQNYYLHDLAGPVDDTSNIDPRIESPSNEFASDLSITGSKGFSVQTGEGNSGLSQSLNLTIQGQLVPGLQTSAHISDNSKGGSGATRRLEELDKIYIEAQSEHFKGTFGDFDYIQNRDPLLCFQRKLTGLDAQYFRDGNLFRVAAAFFPGQFSSITISGQDGRLGPYYLTDIGGRPGAVILPGSERVYLDGILQKRGSQNDYELDYESGALQFTPSKVIRAESRITIDYEISREEYSRGFYTTTGQINPIGSLRVFGSLLQEGDNKNSPKSFEMTDENQAILQNAGADRLDAAKSGVRDVGIGNGDYNAVSDSIGGVHYVYAGQGGGNLDIAFSFVGGGLGSYRTLGAGAFEFVGAGGGDYEPVILLPLPEVKRYGSLGSSWNNADSTFNIEMELAGSSFDRNTVSTIDPLRQGLAGKGTISLKRKAFGPAGFIGSRINIRSIGANTVFPGRIDDVERYRRYDLQPDSGFGGEKVGEFALSGGLDNRRTVSIEGGYLTHQNFADRKRQAGAINWSLIGPLNGFVSAERTTGERTWWKRSAGLSASMRRLQPSFLLNYESRDRLGGFKYYEYTGRIPVSYTGNINGETELVLRDEKYLDGIWKNKFISGSAQQKVSFVAWQSGFSGDISGLYYKKNYKDFPGTNQEQRTGQSRLSYSDPRGRGSLSINERLNSSNERLRAKNYIFVGAGKGDYRLQDGEYIKDPQGDYILIIEEVGEGARVAEINSELGGSLAPFVIADPKREIEKSIGRLNIEANLTFNLRKLSNSLLGEDFIPWKISGRENISYQTGQLDFRVYYYPPYDKQRIKYNASRSFEDGAPYANESANNNFRSDELSWFFPIGKPLDMQLGYLTSRSRRLVNGVGYTIQRDRGGALSNYRFAEFWILSLGSSLESARQSDTGLRALMPSGELGLARDFRKTGRISGRLIYSRMNIKPQGVYIPYQLASGKKAGDNLEANLTARMQVTKNGRLDFSYRFQSYEIKSRRNNLRLEFTVLFL